MQRSTLIAVVVSVVLAAVGARQYQLRTDLQNDFDKLQAANSQLAKTNADEIDQLKQNIGSLERDLRDALTRLSRIQDKSVEAAANANGALRPQVATVQPKAQMPLPSASTQHQTTAAELAQLKAQSFETTKIWLATQAPGLTEANADLVARVVAEGLASTGEYALPGDDTVTAMNRTVYAMETKLEKTLDEDQMRIARKYIRQQQQKFNTMYQQP